VVITSSREAMRNRAPKAGQRRRNAVEADIRSTKTKHTTKQRLRFLLQKRRLTVTP